MKRTADDIEDGNEPVWSLASSQYLQQKSKTGFVGLSNQGATCYLNSLIQTLYMTPELRSALYSWTYDPIHDGPEESCIPLHLQRLFLRLQLGYSAIVETKDLTTSFGWSGSQALQQHDVQELLRKLFEALDVCLTRGATAIRSTKPSNASSDTTSNNTTTANAAGNTQNDSQTPTPAADNRIGNLTASIVNDLYEGMILDYIRCMECNHSRERLDPFYDVSVAIRDVESLEGGLEKYLTPEILSDDNQWNCDQCGTKVDAFKGLQFSRLPYFLTLQLTRFDYDYQTWRRIKLNNKVTFPFTLDMAKFFTDQKGAAGNQEYELFSVMIHSGGAEGGHYYAFVKSFESGKWFKFNDASVSEISDEDICTVFGGAPPKNQASTVSPAGSAPAPPPAPSTASAASGASSIPKPPPLGSSYSTNAYMLLYRLVDPHRNKNSVSKEEVPEHLMQWIQHENAEFEKIRAEHQKRLDNVAITVFYDKSLQANIEEEEEEADSKTANPAPTATDGMNVMTVNVDKHETLRTALASVYESGLARTLKLNSLSCFRLRPFTPQTGTKAPSWLDASLDSTLEQLNFGHQKNTYLEVKESTQDWVDEDVHYTIGVIKFNGDGFDPAVSLHIPWRLNLGDLKWYIIKYGGNLANFGSIASLKKRYENVELESASDSASTSELTSTELKNGVLIRVFVVDSSANCRELKSETGVLNEVHQINDGQCVHIEYMPAREEANQPMHKSLVAARFEEERHKIQIFYNHFDSNNFDNSILIDSRRLLKDLKAEIATVLGVTSGEFKMCRNLLSKEFNNLELSIAGANLYEGSAVCIVRGRPLGVNELKLKISVYKGTTDDEESFSTPWTLSIDENCTVEELRAQITSCPEFEDHLKSVLSDASSSQKHIRLREKKSGRCSTVLFDGDSLKQAIENLSDNDEVAVQILDAPDKLSRADLILIFRRWVPKLRALEPTSFELVVPRTATMGEARRLLSEYLASTESKSSEAVMAEANTSGTESSTLNQDYSRAITLQHLVISKPYLFMIKKKDAAALSGLNWELADDLQLTQSPWYLNDGSLLLYKDMSDPEHGNAEASSLGSNGSSQRSQGRLEQGVKIHTIYDEKPIKSENTAETPTSDIKQE